MKSNETKDTSLDISKNKANPNKPVLFTIKSPNNELLNKKMFRVRTKKEKTSNVCLRYGYWSKSDHDKFIEALYLYENDWPRIQMFIKNRTHKQVRSHAQKFYLKLKTFKDDELGLDFTSSNIKCLENIIYIVKKKESISGNYGKLLHIISERISFGKKPLKREQERLAKINEKNQINNSNGESQMNDNIINFNNFNSLNQMNFQTLLIYTQIFNQQILKCMNFNIFPTNNNNIRNNFGNIFTNNNVQINDLFIPKKISMYK